MRFRRTASIAGSTAASLLYVLPSICDAHVKWFANYDLGCAPRSPEIIFTNPLFLTFCLGVIPLIFAVIAVESYFGKGQLLHAAMKPFTATELTGEKFGKLSAAFPSAMRAAVAVFFSVVFITGWLNGADKPVFFLTPELKTYQPWVLWMQLAIAVCALTNATAWLSACGICILYGAAAGTYGIFHLADYPIFLGVAVYLFLGSRYGNERRQLADRILRTLTGITLLWGGVEKFCYPEWSFDLLVARPDLAFGFTPEFYMMAAGFVEFCAAFLLIVGQSSARACAALLLMIFVSAIIPFGMIDAIGHFIIIVVLMVLILQQKNPVTSGYAHWSPYKIAAAHSALFTLALPTLIVAYCVGHRLAYH